MDYKIQSRLILKVMTYWVAAIMLSVHAQQQEFVYVVAVEEAADSVSPNYQEISIATVVSATVTIEPMTSNVAIETCTFKDNSTGTINVQDFCMLTYSLSDDQGLADNLYKSGIRIRSDNHITVQSTRVTPDRVSSYSALPLMTSPSDSSQYVLVPPLLSAGSPDCNVSLWLTAPPTLSVGVTLCSKNLESCINRTVTDDVIRRMNIRADDVTTLTSGGPLVVFLGQESQDASSVCEPDDDMQTFTSMYQLIPAPGTYENRQTEYIVGPVRSPSESTTVRIVLIIPEGKSADINVTATSSLSEEDVVFSHVNQTICSSVDLSEDGYMLLFRCQLPQGSGDYIELVELPSTSAYSVKTDSKDVTVSVIQGQTTEILGFSSPILPIYRHPGPHEFHITVPRIRLEAESTIQDCFLTVVTDQNEARKILVNGVSFHDLEVLGLTTVTNLTSYGIITVKAEPGNYHVTFGNPYHFILAASLNCHGFPVFSIGFPVDFGYSDEEDAVTAEPVDGQTDYKLELIIVSVLLAVLLVTAVIVIVLMCFCPHRFENKKRRTMNPMPGPEELDQRYVDPPTRGEENRNFEVEEHIQGPSHSQHRRLSHIDVILPARDDEDGEISYEPIDINTRQPPVVDDYVRMRQPRPMAGIPTNPEEELEPYMNMSQAQETLHRSNPRPQYINMTMPLTNGHGESQTDSNDR